MSPRQPIHNFHDFETLGQVCWRILRQLLPDGHLRGHEYVACNPTRPDHRPGSFSYNVRKNIWADFATGEKGRGIVSLCAYINKTSYRDAAIKIRRLSGEGHNLPYTARNHNFANTDAKPPKLPKLEKDEKLQNYIEQIWRQTLPAAGTKVSTYLAVRGLNGDIPEPIRYSPQIWHPETRTFRPSMVAAITVCPHNKIVGLHRTFLNADGTGKAEIEPNKKILGRASGGAVRLDAPGEKLVVAEGIETALSLRQATGLPTWAALSANGIASLVLPEMPLAAEVVIGADNDPAGLRAAESAAEKWLRQGRKVRIALPGFNEDFNDLLRKK